MTPGRYDLSLYRGDSYKWRFQLWADLEKTVPVDLTGATVAAEIRDKSAGTNIVVLDTVLVPADGVNVIDMAFPAARWVGVGVLGAVWDIEVTFPDGVVATPVAGRVAVTGDVTNSTVGP